MCFARERPALVPAGPHQISIIHGRGLLHGRRLPRTTRPEYACCRSAGRLNGPWVVESPASLGVREVCSVILTGNTRAGLPPARGARALGGAREAAVAPWTALGRRLGHYVGVAREARRRRGRAGAVGARCGCRGGSRGGSEAAVM